MGEAAVRILVVDDEPAIREVLDVRLSEWDYSVILAATGDEALISRLVNPSFRSLRSEPRYTRLLKKMGLGPLPV